ncbi:hypothetical protein Vretifemale_10010, partial [Volvox reticuliferus]
SQPVHRASALSAACITIWLDWDTGSHSGAVTTAIGSGGGGGPSHAIRLQQAPTSFSPPPLPPLPQVAVRWEMFCAYCRFLIARRLRIIASWHALVATASAASHPLPPPPGAPVASVLSLGNLLGLTGGGGQGSIESCGGGGGTAPAVNRTASFTSRAPVMMEFVEELPTPAPSVQRRDPRAIGGAAFGATGGGVTATASAIATSATAAVSTGGNNGAATLDDSYTHSTSTAAPYGIAGLVVEPMGSSEDPDEAEDGGDEVGEVGGAMAAPPQRLQLAQRSFVMPSGSSFSHRAKAFLGMRPSHSSPDLKKLMAGGQSQGGTNRWHGAEIYGDSTANSKAVCAAAQVAAQEAEAVAYAHGSVYYSSQASTSSTAAIGTSAASGGGVIGGGASGSQFDWSLVMASVNSGPRHGNSAGHTPIPSAAVNRLSPLSCSADIM